MKKYKFTGEKKVFNGVTLRRIVAVMDFYAQKPYNPDAFDEFEYRLINKGTLGGWLESEENLSHEGFAWVADEACVYGKAKVIEGGLVYGEAQIFDHARIENYARIFDRAAVHGEATITCRAAIWGDAVVSCGYISDDANIYGNAQLIGDGSISVGGSAEICDYALIDSRTDGSIIIGDCAMICGNAIVLEDPQAEQGEINIAGRVKISGEAIIHSGSMIWDEACICDSAQIFNAEITGSALICGKTIVQHDTRIGGHAKINFTNADEMGAYLLPCIYLAGYAEVNNHSDYFIVDPIALGDKMFSLIFFRDAKGKAKMTICRVLYRILHRIGSDSYPISNNIILESLLNDDFEDDDNVPPELIETVLALAKIARDRLAQQKTEEQA